MNKSILLIDRDNKPSTSQVVPCELIGGLNFWSAHTSPHRGCERGRRRLGKTGITMMATKNFRKRILEQDEENEEEESRLALEEVKLLQRQRERRPGIPALLSADAAGAAHNSVRRGSGGGGGDGDEKEDLVLQDTFAQETAVTIEDPNMLKFVEQELAKKRGRTLHTAPNEEERDAVDELYVIPEHLKVKKRNSEESSTQWTTGIAEVQLPIEYKLRNIEETEAAKKLLQDKRLVGRTKSDLSIPSSYSADYFQRGRDYAEKLRREHPELYKDGVAQVEGMGTKSTQDSNPDVTGRRQAATDQFMLERFRKREKHRVMRR